MKSRIAVLALAAALVSASGLPGQSVTLKVLHGFGAPGDGFGPFGPPVLDSNGNLYGTTATGGTGVCSDYGCGTVFELSAQPGGVWSETILHSFTGGSGGAFPWGAPIFDAKGNLYLTVEGYGSADVGGVFMFTPGSDGWTYDVLYGDGAGPGLLTDKVGDLYGAIGPGNYFGLGAIGELSPSSSSWAYTQLYSFCGPGGCPDGYNPPAPPIFDAKGNLWGTMFYGGIVQPACPAFEGCGVIYAMTPSGDNTWTYHVVHRFASFSNDGQFPEGGLVIDAAGNFYGTTEGGGPHGYGAIFKFAPSGDTLKGTLLYDFPSCQTGCYPEGTLAIDSTGNLYGTASGGIGNCGGLECGLVFRLSPQANGSWKYSVISDLNEITGGVSPFYGVILDGKGNLYGVTSSGGAYGGGTAFEISP